MKRILAILTCFSIVALGCTKENSNEFFPYPGHELNDTNWYSVVPSSARVRQLDSIFAIHPSTDSVSVVNGGTVHFDSIRIDFPPGFCAGGPGTVISKVKIEVVVLKTKGDMVKTDRPTMSYNQLLVTGGALHIRATYNGQPVAMAQGKLIKISMITKMSNSTPSTNMHVFFGKEDAFPASAVQTFTWIPWQDSIASWVNSYQDSATGLKGYEFFSNRFGWINADYFSDTTQPRTKASVLLPPNFTNANTNVYAVLQSPDIVAQLKPDHVTKKFEINNIYVGKVVTFVSLSFIDGKLYLGSSQVTIGNNTTVSLAPQLQTKQQIEAFLQSL